jgi:hypothetical protein
LHRRAHFQKLWPGGLTATKLISTLMKTRALLVQTLATGVCALVVTAGGAEQQLNTLTAAEKEAGWRLLFDGQSTKGWRGYGKTEFPK